VVQAMVRATIINSSCNLNVEDPLTQQPSLGMSNFKKGEFCGRTVEMYPLWNKHPFLNVFHISKFIVL